MCVRICVFRVGSLSVLLSSACALALVAPLRHSAAVSEFTGKCDFFSIFRGRLQILSHTHSSVGKDAHILATSPPPRSMRTTRSASAPSRSPGCSKRDRDFAIRACLIFSGKRSRRVKSLDSGAFGAPETPKDAFGLVGGFYDRFVDRFDSGGWRDRVDD